MSDATESDTPTSSYNRADMDGTSDSSPFERCPECGRSVVALAQHTCPTETTDTKPAADEREQLANNDDRDPSRAVLLPPGTDAKAYHEIEGEPDTEAEADPDAVEVICSRTTATAAGTIRTQREANDRGYYPCGSCRRIEQRTTSQDI